MRPNYLDGMFDQVDAAVFSSDMLHVDEHRALFQEYVNRWSQALMDSDPGPSPEVRQVIVQQLFEPNPIYEGLPFVPADGPLVYTKKD